MNGVVVRLDMVYLFSEFFRVLVILGLWNIESIWGVFVVGIGV